MLDFTIDEPPIPTALDGPGAADFVAAIEVANEVEGIGFGSHDLDFLPSEELPSFQPNEFETKRMLVARANGAIVGRALYETTKGGGADTAWLVVQVLPAFRRHGVGRALADAVEALAVAEGKAKAVTYVVSPDDGSDDRLASPTGFGSVPRANAEVQFLLVRGYSLEQVERASRIALPVPAAELADRLAEATARSGPDYAIRSWVNGVPERWREDVAVLLTRMSTDEPQGNLDQPEDPWTVERLAAADLRDEANPRDRLTVAVEHLPTGRLAGFSELTVPVETDRAVSQESTIVLSEHRGHKLGMLLKVANFDHLQRERPGHPSIYTFNAEENRFMLDVNEAVGFVPFAYNGAWKKVLG